MDHTIIIGVGFTACVVIFVGCLIAYAAYKKFKKWRKGELTNQNLSAV